MNLARWLLDAARAHPCAPALLTGTTLERDYAGFAISCARIARLLNELGISPGDRVALYHANSSSYLEALFGIWWAGAVAVPINCKLHLKEAAWIVADAGARVVFTDERCKADFSDSGTLAEVLTRSISAGCSDIGCESPWPRASGDLAWLFYTSGTTGRPKGVMLTHANLMAMSLCYPTDVDDVSPEDAALYAAPLSHGAGLYSIIHVRKAARHVVPESGAFDADEVLDLAKVLGNITMFAAPTMVIRLVKRATLRGERGEGIRTIVYGGGPMYRTDIEQAIAVMGHRFVQIYGQGECPMAITALSRADHRDPDVPRRQRRLGSVGRAQSLVEIRIAGEDGKEVPSGVTGEIEVRGLPVMAGYWKDAEATASAFRGGWLRTGDIGFLDRDGFLSLTDRSKDVIISGGSNIYPREVEEALLDHPAIEEVSVIGLPDPEWGECVVAFVVLKCDAIFDERDLDTHCRASIAGFKRPKRYFVLDALPKNAYGKVLKRDLRTSYGIPN